MRLQTYSASAENVLLCSFSFAHVADPHYEARRLPEFNRFHRFNDGYSTNFKTVRRQSQAPVVTSNPRRAFNTSRHFVETTFRTLSAGDRRRLVEPIKQASRSGEHGLLRDVWYSKLRASKLPSTEQALRMVIGVLQGTHKRPVQLPSSTNSIGTDPNLSQRAKDAGIKLHDTTFYDAMCRVDAELGRRILDNLDSVFRATDAYSMLAAVVAFLQNVTTQDTLDMGTEAWEKTTRSLLRVLWETLRAQNRYTSQTRPASGAERIQHVESALNRQANLFREPAIARTVKRAARRFPQPSAAMDGPELLLRVVSDGLSQVDPPLSSVNMSTWSARRAGPHRVLLTIADGRQFPTLNRLVLTIRRAAGDSDHQRIRNLLGIAQLPLSVVWAIGRQAFEELLDLAMRTEISPSRSPAVVVPDAVWRAPIRVKRIGAAAVDQDESAVGQGDECVVCAEAWSQHELAALDDYCQQFKTKSDPVTSPSVRRLNLLRSGLDANYCGHFFHKKCMSEWGGTCPLCRAHWISTPS